MPYNQNITNGKSRKYHIIIDPNSRIRLRQTTILQNIINLNFKYTRCETHSTHHSSPTRPLIDSAKIVGTSLMDTTRFINNVYDRTTTTLATNPVRILNCGEFNYARVLCRPGNALIPPRTSGTKKDTRFIWGRMTPWRGWSLSVTICVSGLFQWGDLIICFVNRWISLSLVYWNYARLIIEMLLIY